MGNLRRALALALACTVMSVSSAAGASTVAAAGAHPRLWLQRFIHPPQGRYTSPVVEVPSGFSSAVVSWNVSTPNGSWIETHLRARIGQRWTAWYDMGHWSAQLSSDNRRSRTSAPDADGRVDTDTLFLRAPAEAFQVSVEGHAGSAAEVPKLALLAVTTGSGKNGASASGRASSHVAWGDEIQVPERTQHVHDSPDALGGGGEAWCSPTSVSMVMAYWSARLHHPEWDADVATAANGTFDPVYDGCGNWPFNVAYASEHGLAGWVERLAGLRDIEAYVQAGLPVIASIKVKPGELAGSPYKKTDGHLLVVRGFDKAGDVIVNDPAGRPGNIRRVYRRAQFEHVWQHGSGGIVYVIGPADLLQRLRS
jgi:Peptidase_C39 like family